MSFNILFLHTLIMFFHNRLNGKTNLKTKHILIASTLSALILSIIKEAY